MPKDTITASAINLAEIAAHPVEALAALVQVVQSQEAELQRLRDVHKKFAIATTNEADELRGWVEDLDRRVQHIKPKDLRNSITAEESMDRIVEALHKRQSTSGYITYSQIAGILDISESRVCQLKRNIQTDKRLTLSYHPSNKKLRIVTLNPMGCKMT